MPEVKNFRELTCSECREGAGLGFDFTMALQPIVDISTKTVFAQEALARGIGDSSAENIFSKVNDTNRYAFDQACRVKALELAARLKISSLLSINFMPNAVYRPELCIRTTLWAAEEYDFPISQIMFEVTESEKVEDLPHLESIIHHYRERGFITALDDFGAGYAGLTMLSELDVDILKLDMHLVRNIDQNERKHALVKGIVSTADELGIRVIAEGVETREELSCLKELGITLFQGYYIARPACESVADIDWSVIQD